VRTAPKNPKDAEEQPVAAPAPKDEAPERTPSKKGGDGKDKGGKGKDGKDGKDGKEGKEGKGKSGKPGASTSKAKPIPDNPNFRYIVRMAGSDLDGRRPTALALTGVRGVGLRIAEVACRIAQVDAAEMIGNVPEPTVDQLESVLLALPEKLPVWMLNHPSDYATGVARHLVSGDLETARRDDINQMKMIRSYRGVRHERGQKVRGQRTRSNGRTGMAAGVLKKTAREQAAAKGKEAAAPAAPAAPAAAPAAEKKPAPEKKA
jgi:small subunit ribosomal protein S13